MWTMATTMVTTLQQDKLMVDQSQNRLQETFTDEHGHSLSIPVNFAFVFTQLVAKVLWEVDITDDNEFDNNNDNAADQIINTTEQTANQAE